MCKLLTSRQVKSWSQLFGVFQILIFEVSLLYAIALLFCDSRLTCWMHIVSSFLWFNWVLVVAKTVSWTWILDLGVIIVFLFWFVEPTYNTFTKTGYRLYVMLRQCNQLAKFTLISSAYVKQECARLNWRLFLTNLPAYLCLLCSLWSEEPPLHIWDAIGL